MELTLEEQELLARCRRLRPEGRRELVDYAEMLANKERHGETSAASEPAGQCSLEKHEKRPEASKEPIFTE